MPKRCYCWEEDGTWNLLWRGLIVQLDTQGLLDWQESSKDGSFVSVKKGLCVGKPKASKGTKSIVVSDG